MSCDQFIERYTDFRDGLLDAETREEVQMHLASCSCCARYDSVMQRGLELLSDLPLTESSDDFMPRLRHRLYNVDCGVEGRRSFGGSAALVGVAAVGLLALFWLPFAATVPLEMELPAVSAQFPPPGAVEEMPSLFRSGPFVTTLLLEDESHLDGYLTEFEWPPPPQLRSSVAIEASYLRSEPALFNR